MSVTAVTWSRISEVADWQHRLEPQPGSVLAGAWAHLASLSPSSARSIPVERTRRGGNYVAGSCTLRATTSKSSPPARGVSTSAAMKWSGSPRTWTAAAVASARGSCHRVAQCGLKARSGNSFSANCRRDSRVPRNRTDLPRRVPERQQGVPMISYAQNAEDVVLMRAFSDVREGFYIDVSASTP